VVDVTATDPRALGSGHVARRRE